MNLLTLARDNKWRDIERLVRNGAPVMYGNQMGQTALHIASLWGHVETIKTLLRLGSDANVENTRGSTPLHFAAGAKENAHEACQVLLDAGANPELTDMAGRKPFELATDDEVRALLGGPDPKLFQYCSEGDHEKLRELLISGKVSSIRVVDAEGRTPANLAAHSQSIETLQVLFTFDPEAINLPDGQGHSIVHAAVESENLDVLRFVLSLKPDVNSQNMNESEYASGNWILQGEPIMPVDKTPLHLAVEGGDVQAAQLLLEAGALPNILDFDGQSALHKAIESLDEDMAALLLDRGAAVNQPNKDITSCCHLAAQRGSLKLLQLLLAHGADANMCNDDGWTPLHLAARSGKGDKVGVLVGAGADVGAVNKQGNSALHLAAVNGHVGVVRVLVAAGASVDVVNKDGKSAADLAKSEEVRVELQGAQR